MQNFVNAATSNSLTVKLWRGERMCLIGMDVNAPEDDFVGFAIEVKSPGATDYVALRNRLNFDYSDPATKGVDGFRNYLSTSAPFQKFRWIHFPYQPTDGDYLYRVTKIHMNPAGQLHSGDRVADLDIKLERMVYDNYLEVGFTRNFASSQAYNDKYNGNQHVIPASGKPGLSFQKLAGDVYQWMGFEAYELIFGILKEVQGDPHLSLDVFAYDFDEPDILKELEACGNRVRAIIDNSSNHAASTSDESVAAARLAASAGANAVRRMHFHTLQHNKVLIVRRDGVPEKVLFGSTNFSFRGLYIQANNALVFYSSDAAGLFGNYFDLAFAGGVGFASNPLSTKWNPVQPADQPLGGFLFFAAPIVRPLAQAGRRRDRSGDLFRLLCHRLSEPDQIGPDSAVPSTG